MQKLGRCKRASAVLLALLLTLSFLVPAFADFENDYVLTGNGATDIIGVAYTQVDYYEPADGTTKYGEYMGHPDMEWCGAFIAWCAHEAQIDPEVIPKEGSSNALKAYYDARGQYRSAEDGLPLPGDIAFFSYTYSVYNISHVGLVTSVDNGVIRLVEGNYGIASPHVAATSYEIGDPRLVGFASPDYGAAFDGYRLGDYQTGYALRLRSEPDDANDATILTLMPKGTRITVTEVRGAWGYTSFEGFEGWCHLGYCTFIPADYHGTRTLVADISKWNPASRFDWDALKNDGVDGVIIRIGGRGYAGDRDMYEDDAFMAHYTAAKEAGLHVGVYFFSYALNGAEAAEEARFTVELLRENGCVLDMPVFIDIEDYSDGGHLDYKHFNAGREACTEVVNVFCDEVKKAGFYPGLYCNKYFAETLLDDSAFQNRAVWIAQYGVAQCGWAGRYDLWQYTPYGDVSGYDGYIDLSYCYTDFPTLIGGTSAAPKDYGEHVISKDWTVLTQATCRLDGVRVKTCVDCGKELLRETVNSVPHTASREMVRLLSTDLEVGAILPQDYISRHLKEKAEDYLLACEQSGGTVLTYCTACRKILSVEKYFPEAHPGQEHETETYTVAASCVADGRTYEVCSLCAETVRGEVLQAKRHTFSNTEIKKAACSEPGEYVNTCTYCGETLRVEYAPPGDHRFGAASVTRLPTFTVEGEKTRECTICGALSAEPIPVWEPGDVDDDGEATAADARLALRASVELEALDEKAAFCADVDGSASVDAADARLILRLCVGLETRESILAAYGN